MHAMCNDLECFCDSRFGISVCVHYAFSSDIQICPVIQETTPLAGASAGAIVCAVIASGADMHDALKATKILAEDCRLKGTAFRLGVCVLRVLIMI